MNYLISAFLFLLPFQTQWILRYGVLNGQSWEYGTIGIFATDILLLLVLTLSLREPWSPLRGISRRETIPALPAGRQTKRQIAWLAIIVLIVLASIVMADDRWVALLHTLWLVEAGIVAWLVSRSQNRSIVIDFFIVGSVLQAFIGLWQFFSQSTVASSIMGWASHPAWQPGTSVIEVAGERWLRAYAGLPHPNIFGGWMAISVIIAFWLVAKETKPWVRSLLYCFIVVLSSGLAVSFSRSAWIAAAVGITVLFVVLPPRVGGNRRGVLTAVAILLLSFCATLLPYRHLFSTRVHATARLEQQSLNERVQGYQDAFALIREHPFLGVGMGNFTPSFASENPHRPLWSIQPVHNVFLLILAEIGIVGFVVLMLLLVILLEIRNWKLEICCPILYSLFSVLFVLALFDHYLWSLHTGLLLTGLIMGWIASKPFFARE